MTLTRRVRVAAALSLVALAACEGQDPRLPEPRGEGPEEVIVEVEGVVAKITDDELCLNTGAPDGSVPCNEIAEDAHIDKGVRRGREVHVTSLPGDDDDPTGPVVEITLVD